MSFLVLLLGATSVAAGAVLLGAYIGFNKPRPILLVCGVILVVLGVIISVGL